MMPGMQDELVCWKCGTPLTELVLPVARIEQCRACGADLHVCRLCGFYNARVSDHCDEPLAAGQVREVDRANFCDYFKIQTGAYTARAEAADQRARSELGALFGDSGTGEGDGRPSADRASDELESLFRK